MELPTQWCFDPAPAVDGWFAVIRCWEVEEGAYPDAVWFEGGQACPRDNGGIADDGSSGHAGPFPTRSAATDWGYEHDPGW